MYAFATTKTFVFPFLYTKEKLYNYKWKMSHPIHEHFDNTFLITEKLLIHKKTVYEAISFFFFFQNNYII